MWVRRYRRRLAREILSRNQIPAFGTGHVIRWFLPLALVGAFSYVFDLDPVIRVTLVLIAEVVGLAGFCIASGVYAAARFRFGGKPRYSYLDPRNG
jgi:hypothetical protein